MRADDIGNFQSILLIVSGGIACYKSAELLRLLIKRGCNVECVLTEGAQQFVTPLLFSSLSGKQAHTSLFSVEDEARMGHIALARQADAVIIAPATAHMIAKAANGLADDLASTLLLAADAPLYIAPAMNPTMYTHPAVQRNIDILRRRGARIISPELGVTACGETGEGRLPDPATIIDVIFQETKQDPIKKRAEGLHVLITSGATRERLDPVRYLTNFSSGKQGASLANVLLRRGARVTYVHGVNAVLPHTHNRLTCIEAESAADMLAACNAAPQANIAICAAAVCDWRPLYNNSKKQKKIPGQEQINIAFEPTADILYHIANRTDGKRPNVVVGFAAETASNDDELLTLAQEKLQRKKCDMLVANNVSSDVFGSDQNAVTILMKDSDNIVVFEREDKDVIASRIADTLLRTYL